MPRDQINAPPPPPGAVGMAGQGRFIQTTHSDVAMPFQASAITGALLATLLLLLVGAVAYARRWSALDLLLPLAFGWCAVALSITIIAWFLERHAIKETWWRAEEHTGTDLDGDGKVGRPKVDAVQVRDWRDADTTRRSAEQLHRQRFEEFIAKLYAADATDTATIRSLGFTEAERREFIAALREAELIENKRRGDTAGWTFTAPDAEACVFLTRKRIMFLARSSSSSSSTAE